MGSEAFSAAFVWSVRKPCFSFVDVVAALRRAAPGAHAPEPWGTSEAKAPMATSELGAQAGRAHRLLRRCHPREVAPAPRQSRVPKLSQLVRQGGENPPEPAASPREVRYAEGGAARVTNVAER
jgi:hypothetical protein